MLPRRSLFASLLLAATLLTVPGCDEQAAPNLETSFRPIIGGTNDYGHPAVGVVMTDSSICTGTLISPKIVLTAAHCAAYGYTPKWFLLGSTMDNPETTLYVKKWIPNPNYSDAIIDGYQLGIHDIAIIVLTDAAPVEPMKYRTASLTGKEGSTITFVGFGRTSVYYEDSSGTKMKVNSTIGDINAQGFWNYTSPSNPKNTCSGDSGGPALLSVGGEEEVISVVSSGDENCVQNGWNTRVDIHAAWIQGLINTYDPGGVTTDCGNGVCEAGESEATCPADCGSTGPTCGNGACESGETATSCPADCGSGGCGSITYEGCCEGSSLFYCDNGSLQQLDCSENPSCGWNSQSSFYDCGTGGGSDPSGTYPKTCGGSTGPVCGDGTCEGTETSATCPADCGSAGPVCGDGKCEGTETYSNCSKDCPKPVCGDGKCESPETSTSCPKDCDASYTPTCGDGKCESPETSTSCPKDCDASYTPTCGDGKCEAPETSTSCPQDCDASYTPTCGDGKCEGTETSQSCAPDCNPDNLNTCGNGYCEQGETPTKCPEDCSGNNPPSCGNGYCEVGETASGCPADCAAVSCGDGKCEAPETSTSCPADCVLQPVCGDGKCQGSEDDQNCAEDCFVEVCGDNMCSLGEECEACPEDCGFCFDVDGDGKSDADCSAGPATRTPAAAVVLLLLLLAALLRIPTLSRQR